MARYPTANAFTWVAVLANMCFAACGRDALDAFPTDPGEPDSDDGVAFPEPVPFDPPKAPPPLPQDPTLPGGRLLFESERVDFGLVMPGSIKEMKIGLLNDSDQKVAAPRLSLSGDLVFQILNTTCERSLEPGAKCSVSVRFAPRSETHFSTTLAATTSASKAEVRLTGRSTETPIPMANLVGHWTFEDQSGLVPDLSGSKNDGQAVEGLTPNAGPGKPVLVEGRKPGTLAIDFSRSDAWVRVKSSPSINKTGLLTQFTLAAWVRLTAKSKDGLQWIVSRQELGTAHKHFGLGLHDGAVMGVVHFFFATGATPLSHDGKWRHLAATYDGVTLQVYQDGIIHSKVDIGWPLSEDTTPVVMGAGQGITHMSEFFRGEVDEVMLFTKHFSEQEMLSLAN